MTRPEYIPQRRSVNPVLEHRQAASQSIVVRVATLEELISRYRLIDPGWADTGRAALRRTA